MSAEQLHIGDEIDPIMNDLRARHDEIARRAAPWIEMKDALLPLVGELILLGCEFSMSSNYDDDLNIRFTGDKQKFLTVVRAQFRHGLKPDVKSLAKGSIGFSRPSLAESWASNQRGWLRAEERWNGHRLLPPVGMQSAQASHEWRLPQGSGYGSCTDFYYTKHLTLEPRDE